jgi:hypothetical protein
MSTQAVTSARVDIIMQTNVTFQYAFQFGDPDDTTWTFTGQKFRMDLKKNKYVDTVPLLTLDSDSGEIVVDDVTQRVLHFNVPETSFSAAGVIPGDYDYDLIMYDTAVPALRVALMHGKFKMKQGVSEG